jgi:hypothetical protein
MPPFLKDPKQASPTDTVNTAHSRDGTSPSLARETGSATNEQPLKLIPWSDIWSSLRVARVRGNGEMIEVFYNTLFREAIFDDRGAWSWNCDKRN